MIRVSNDVFICNIWTCEVYPLCMLADAILAAVDVCGAGLVAVTYLGVC